MGKTTIIKKLLDTNYKVKLGSESSTQGINISSHIFTPNFKSNKYYFDEEDLDYEEDSIFDTPDEMDSYFSDNKNTEYKLNIWDFGGQEIYHSTHQFFLTKRSVYVLVWESRKDEISSAFDYWLNIISILGKNSPVIIVQNKIDSRESKIPEAQLKKKFQNIVEFRNVSCLANIGIEELWISIKNTFKNLPHIGDSLPKSWDNLKEELSNIKKDYISFDRFKEICLSHGIKDKRAKIISEYLHDLGLIIHYKDDLLLVDLVIINPEWATSALYSLLDHRKVISSQGRFNLFELKELLDQNRYPFEKHNHLLRLMEKFELCFKVLGTNDYILPELLAQEDSNIEKYVDFSKFNLEFNYKYEFLPSGIMTRLICKTNFLIYKNLFSKNSLVLFFEDSLSVIYQDLISKEIKIKLSGNSNSELLALVRREIQEINQSLNLNSNIDFKEHISCICSECSSSKEPYFFDLNFVKNLEIKKEPFIQCYRSGERIEIKQLKKGLKLISPSISLLKKIVHGVQILQSQKLSIKANENSRNSILCEVLKKEKDIVLKDQTLLGSSPSGKSPGEIDIKIENPSGNTISIIEAFILKGLDKRVIQTHLDKIFIYDANGLDQNFILVYSDSMNFNKLWEKYKNHLNDYEFAYPKIQPLIDISNEESTVSEIKIGKTIHTRNSRQTTLFHIFVNFYTYM